jgi:bifunctional DNase/RNase
MKCEHCPNAAVCHLTDVVSDKQFVVEQHLCVPCSERLLPREWPVREWVSQGEVLHLDGAMRFWITQVRICEYEDMQVILLQQAGAGRTFLLACGMYEAAAVDRFLKGMRFPRPMTHDGWADAIAALGGVLEAVVIADMRDNAYYASLRIRQRAAENEASVEAIRAGSTPSGPQPTTSRLIEVDVRPSDAFALAVRQGIPIFIKEEVLRATDRAAALVQAGEPPFGTPQPFAPTPAPAPLWEPNIGLPPRRRWWQFWR